MGRAGALDCRLGDEWLILEDTPLVKAVWGTIVLPSLRTLGAEETLCGK